MNKNILGKKLDKIEINCKNDNEFKEKYEKIINSYNEDDLSKDLQSLNLTAKNIMDFLISFSEKTQKEREAIMYQAYDQTFGKKYKKEQIKKAKFDQSKSCCFTDKLSQEVIKNQKSKSYDTYSNSITSDNHIKDFGNFQISQNIKETDKSYILENYKNIQFTREEIQIYIAILNVYIQNISKKNYGVSYEFSVKEFHNVVLGRKNRLRKEDLQRYEKMFVLIASKRIIYNSENATIAPFKKLNARVNSTLINIDIISKNNYKDQIIRIVPSELTMLELKQIKQISNFFPVELLKLPFKKSDNIFYFALYFTNLHRNNESHIEKIKGKRPKRIYNKAFKKEINIKTILKKALPNYPEILKKFEHYKNNNSRGKHFFDREILNPLQETINIFIKHGYIDKNYKIPEYSKNILDEKITVIFNYDVGKLIETNKFKKDEKK